MPAISRALAFAFALGLALPVAPAAAAPLSIRTPRPATTPQPATQSGDLFTMNSAEGDYIGGGQNRSFTEDNATFTVLYFDGTYLRVSVTTGDPFDPASEWWTIEVAAPPGSPLAVGSYPNARRAPFRDDAPGLDIYGDGRGCNQVYGKFVVDTANYDESGAIVALDLSYTQHCEGAESPALTGELRLGPTPLEVGASVQGTGVLRMRERSATVSGTVTCTAAATVTVSGSVEQVRSAGRVVNAAFSTEVACEPGAPVTWTATALASTRPAFRSGTATVQVRASAADPAYGKTVSASASGSVVLAARPLPSPVRVSGAPNAVTMRRA